MTRKAQIIITIISVLLVSIYINTSFLSMKMLAGTYISKDNSDFADTPSFGDTLTLYENGKFSSDTWGDGTYELKYSVMGTIINITYNYEFGKGGYSRSVYQPLFGKPRININEDLESYFLRLN